ncbi:hypothetical protein BFN03_03325 [Rhodococcus sp. WMMA185]|uniref:thiamine pyrophosphate-dependent enzyme n=1 Tax=Rhodococcus sp. WMMA185 TaxID=679318 RepID=UPI00087878E0|nr:thiamine pyrophosphate-dependent enzyme [Rhodococcus sp. WMMA185]AOW92060.1 hypothetical protein BFN03_03325 [Rhodococcus sp. WMMA185]
MAGHAVVEQLVAHGADKVYAVPGESYLAVLDGLYEHNSSVEVIITRQEGGAALMAAAHGQLTGKPGICMVTRGPGATNASIGVHVASQDASPMVLFIGQVPRRNKGNRSFQEVDYSAMFGTIAKEVIEINQADRTPELVARAMNTAISGEPGPVVVVLPEDVLTDETTAPILEPPAPMRSWPHPADIERVVQMLGNARSPVIVVGHTRWTSEACNRLRRFAETSDIPVVAAVRCADVIDNDSEAFVGTLGLRTTPGLAEQLEREADLVILLGTRPDALTLSEFPTLRDPERRAKVVHVYPDPDSLDRIVVADVAIPSPPEEFLNALPQKIPPTAERARWRGVLRALCVNNDALIEMYSAEDPAPAFMAVFNKHIDTNAIVSTGAGNYTGWPQRFHRFSTYPSLAGSQSGAMGYSIPAAVAAALAFPDRRVVAFAGDGCFLMNGQELATVSQYRLDVLVVVVNNSRFGTIRDHQERRFPGRVSGTGLANPDFAALARAYGGDAQQVRTPEEFSIALGEFADSTGLRLIEIQTETDGRVDRRAPSHAQGSRQ